MNLARAFTHTHTHMHAHTHTHSHAHTQTLFGSITTEAEANISSVPGRNSENVNLNPTKLNPKP